MFSLAHVLSSSCSPTTLALVPRLPYLLSPLHRASEIALSKLVSTPCTSLQVCIYSDLMLLIALEDLFGRGYCHGTNRNWVHASSRATRLRVVHGLTRHGPVFKLLPLLLPSAFLPLPLRSRIEVFASPSARSSDQDRDSFYYPLFE